MYRKVRSWLAHEIRGRLALIGITKRFFFEMNSVNETEIGKAVARGGGKILETVLTNHTDPKTYPMTLKLGKVDAQNGYVSKLFVVRKL